MSNTASFLFLILLIAFGQLNNYAFASRNNAIYAGSTSEEDTKPQITQTTSIITETRKPTTTSKPIDSSHGFVLNMNRFFQDVVLECCHIYYLGWLLIGSLLLNVALLSYFISNRKRHVVMIDSNVSEAASMIPKKSLELNNTVNDNQDANSEQNIVIASVTTLTTGAKMDEDTQTDMLHFQLSTVETRTIQKAHTPQIVKDVAKNIVHHLRNSDWSKSQQPATDFRAFLKTQIASLKHRSVLERGSLVPFYRIFIPAAVMTLVSWAVVMWASLTDDQFLAPMNVSWSPSQATGYGILDYWSLVKLLFVPFGFDWISIIPYFVVLIFLSPLARIPKIGTVFYFTICLVILIRFLQQFLFSVHLLFMAFILIAFFIWIMQKLLKQPIHQLILVVLLGSFLGASIAKLDPASGAPLFRIPVFFDSYY